jgi:hypothetical protein
LKFDEKWDVEELTFLIKPLSMNIQKYPW